MSTKKAKAVKRLTPSMLKKLIVQERKKMIESSDPVESGVTDPEDVEAEEVEAEDQADTLAKDIDHLKVLKVQESKLRKMLREVSLKRKNLSSRIKKQL